MQWFHFSCLQLSVHENTRKKIARTSAYFRFKICYKTDLDSNIHGHHVYMPIGSCTVDENLFTCLDSREDTEIYDKFSVGGLQKCSSLKYITGT